MSSFLGSMCGFDPRSQEWQIFKNRLTQFLKLNDITSEEQQRALLLTYLSDEAYRLLRNIAHPKVVEATSYKELILLLDGHFTPRRSTFTDKANFYDATQAEGESVQDWAARLRGLAVYCEFGTALDTVFRDRFVLGLRQGPARDRLCEQDPSSLTFAKALELAQQALCAAKAKSIVPGAGAMVVKEEPLYRASASRTAGGSSGGGASAGAERSAAGASRCTVCGLKGHVAQRCRFKNYRCSKCNNKGHLKKVCESRVNCIEVSADQQEDCSDCEECQLFNLRCVDHKPILLKVLVDKINIAMELDSGSSTSVLSVAIYQKYFSSYQLIRCNLRMCFYNGHKITPKGCFSAPVTYGKQTASITFYVVENGGPPLLGRDFMTKFNITFTSMNNKIGLLANSDDNEVSLLLKKYDSLFSDELGKFKYFEVNLELKEGSKPKFFKPRTLPFAIKDQVESELSRLVERGILVPVRHSEYATPIVPVRKANGNVRICVDYSLTLNNDVYIDTYPLPRIEEVFAKLSGGIQFSKLDCKQAYNQFVLSEESQKLTTINTTNGLFMYTRLVFGLACAPAIFQKAIENLLAGIEGVSVFLDDVCITGPSRRIHLDRLEKVFQRFQSAGLKLEKNKCLLFQDSVTYLGHVINKQGLSKCPEKVEAITKAAQPNNVTELKRFLGMANYYRNFVPNASAILSPLHELLRSEARWQWTDRQQEAFDCIKNELASERVLAHFDPDAQLVLSVDAGPGGLGAVLSQVGTDGVERPLAFGSRSLSTSERNYSQLHKEATAIVFAVKRFHQYLYGRRDPFILKTDHKPLLAIFGKKHGISVMTASRLVRYAIFLSAYNYSIQYTTAKDNTVADYFSRSPIGCSDKDHNDLEKELSASCSAHSINFMQIENFPLTYKKIREETLKDEELQTVIKYLRSGWPRKISCLKIMPYFKCKNDLETEDDCLFRGYRVVIPKFFRSKLLLELHSSHQGIVKTKSAARARMWWPGIDRDIEQLIGACTVCSALRPAPPRAPPAPWPRPSAPWERIHLDYMTVGQRTYLVLIDAFSKWVECLEMTNTSTRHLISNIKFLFARFGLPKLIVSDNDPKIASKEFSDFCELNGIKYLNSPIYHPNSNGQAENSVKTCKKMLKAILETCKCPNLIRDKLQDFLFEYRNSVHCTTGLSPAKLMLGRDLRSRLDLILPPCKGEEASENVVNDNDVRSFQIGQTVWVKCYESRKPYWAKGVVTKILGSRMYIVNLLNTNQACRRHIDQLRKYTECPILTMDSNPVQGTTTTSPCSENTPTVEQTNSGSPEKSSTASPEKSSSASPEKRSSGSPRVSVGQAVEFSGEHDQAVDEVNSERGETVDVVVEPVGEVANMVPGPGTPTATRSRRPRNKNVRYKF